MPANGPTTAVRHAAGSVSRPSPRLSLPSASPRSPRRSLCRRSTGQLAAVRLAVECDRNIEAISGSICVSGASPPFHSPSHSILPSKEPRFRPADRQKMGLLEKLQSKIELYRLEQRYARRKHRSSFHAGAQYVDGEYIYTNGPTPPTGPVAKHSTGGASWRPPAWGSSQDSRWR